VTGEAPLDVAFVGGTVVGGGGRAGLDVGVRDGRIVTLAAPGALPAAGRTVDARGLLVLPGIVDTHVHCRAPDHPEREDFDSVTAAAASGGVTTILEMPISTPACATPEVLAARMALAAPQTRVDVGFYAAPGDLDRPRLAEMVAAGAVAFKAMMHGAPPGREASFRGMAMPDDRDLYRALEAVAATGLVLAVHAEHQDLIDLFESRERARPGRDPLRHARSRPVVAEAAAVARLGAMNEAVGARVHVVHVTSERAVAYLRWFRGRGQALTAETTPAYLFASEDDVRLHGPFVKVNPPLRPAADQAGLWGGLDDGALDMVVSDHAPFLADEKEAGWDDVWSVGAGIPGLELTGRLLWDHALAGHVPLERVVGWTSEAPARVFGLDDRKGFVRVGHHADLILLDPARDTDLGPASFHTRSAASIRHVLGRRCRGAIVSVWSRGRLVADGGRVVGTAGAGHVLVPTTTSGRNFA
jgi:dihydroorotase (multifunctional complex type)